jgi:hypothetical protein
MFKKALKWHKAPLKYVFTGKAVLQIKDGIVMRYAGAFRRRLFLKSKFPF